MQSGSRKMNAVAKVSLSYCRGNVYLIAGVCFGLCVSSFLMPVDRDECTETADRIAVSSPLPGPGDSHEPRINVEGKPLRAKKTPQVLARPRYYSTELGIREKLFVGILTSHEHLHSRGVAQNKTIAHLVDKVRYFISIPEGIKPNVTLPGIVGFTDTRSILKPFHALKYITDNYLEDYDYYFLVKDRTYVDGRRLVRLVNKISVGQNVHMGAAGETDTYCSLDSGILLSNSVVRGMKRNLDWCVGNAYSESDDVNFGRCVVRSTSLPCSGAIQGQIFRSAPSDETAKLETDFRGSIAHIYSRASVSIYPVHEHSTIYKINAYVARLELAAVRDQISNLREAMSRMARLGPEKDREPTWPVGNQPGNKPSGRFDVVAWTWFNETHMSSAEGPKNTRETQGSLKVELEYAIASAANATERNYAGKLGYKRLSNGYRKYDASRGVDYILDLIFADLETGEESAKRIEICKPLGRVEILPVPYVTENARVNLILTVNKFQKTAAIKFMTHYAEACMEKRDKTFLMVILLYDVDAPSKEKEDVFYEVKEYALLLTDKFKKDRSKVAWLSIRLPTAAATVELEPMLKIAAADLAVKKLPSESLIAFVETGMELKTDYLNRVRMNTIGQWQIFSPIPFAEYHPDIAYAGSKTKGSELDVNRNFGRYDEYNFNHVSFYAKDYTMARKTAESVIPIVRADRDIATLLQLPQQDTVGSVFELFVSFGDLNALRAPEPSLKIRYKETSCRGTRSDAAYMDCVKARRFNLGNRGQLAKLILQHRRDN